MIRQQSQATKVVTTGGPERVKKVSGADVGFFDSSDSAVVILVAADSSPYCVGAPVTAFSLYSEASGDTISRAFGWFSGHLFCISCVGSVMRGVGRVDRGCAFSRHGTNSGSCPDRTALSSLAGTLVHESTFNARRR